MQEQRAEARRERLLPRDVEVLVAEEDDAVGEQRAADRGDGRVTQVLRDVDAEDLGAERTGDGLDAKDCAPDLVLAGASACETLISDNRPTASPLPTCR
jgi:hypothetical protein